jgi:hypothetical protein
MAYCRTRVAEAQRCWLSSGNKAERNWSNLSMKLRQILSQSLKPKFILFAGSVINVIWHVTWVRRVELEIQAKIGTGHWPYPAHWNPAAVMWEPLLLLAAALGLLINRWWSVLIALLASGRVIYLLGLLPLKAVHSAHDVPMFSWRAMQKAWYVVYTPQPQYLFEAALGVVIFLSAALAFVRSARPTLGV